MLRLRTAVEAIMYLFLIITRDETQLKKDRLRDNTTIVMSTRLIVTTVTHCH